MSDPGSARWVWLVIALPALASAQSGISITGDWTPSSPCTERPVDNLNVPDPAPRMAIELDFDPRLWPEAGTTDIANAFRIGFWAKDHWLGHLELRAQCAHPVWLGLARAAELVLVDFPLGAEMTVLPHELFGHGGRIREFGGQASYRFLPPPPYGFTPSETRTVRAVKSNTLDTQLLISQAGIRVEEYEAHASLLASFEADTFNRIDSGLIVGESIHEVVEATVPFSNSDVRTWTTVQAERNRASTATLRRQYLLSATLTNLLAPSFLYGVYDMVWRYLVLGQRTGPMPSLRVGPVAFWANTHVSPLPWGLDYELDLLARWKGVVFEAQPHFSHGVGGHSEAIDLNVSGIRVARSLVFGGGVSLWVQPGVNVISNGVTLSSANVEQPGLRVHADVRWEHSFWFLGFRIGAKTNGLSGLDPIAPSIEAIALAGVLLERP